MLKVSEDINNINVPLNKFFDYLIVDNTISPLWIKTFNNQEKIIIDQKMVAIVNNELPITAIDKYEITYLFIKYFKKDYVNTTFYKFLKKDNDIIHKNISSIIKHLLLTQNRDIPCDMLEELIKMYTEVKEIFNNSKVFKGIVTKNWNDIEKLMELIHKNNIEISIDNSIEFFDYYQSEKEKFLKKDGLYYIYNYVIKDIDKYNMNQLYLFGSVLPTELTNSYLNLLIKNNVFNNLQFIDNNKLEITSINSEFQKRFLFNYSKKINPICLEIINNTDVSLVIKNIIDYQENYSVEEINHIFKIMDKYAHWVITNDNELGCVKEGHPNLLNIKKLLQMNDIKYLCNIDKYYKNMTPILEKYIIDKLQNKNNISVIDQIESPLSNEYISLINSSKREVRSKLYTIFNTYIRKKLNIENDDYNTYIDQLFIKFIDEKQIYAVSKLDSPMEMIAFLKLGFTGVDLNQITEDQLKNIDSGSLLSLIDIFNSTYQLKPNVKYNCLVMKSYFLFGYDTTMDIIKNTKNNSLGKLVSNVDIKDIQLDENGHPILGYDLNIYQHINEYIGAMEIIEKHLFKSLNNYENINISKIESILDADYLALINRIRIENDIDTKNQTYNIFKDLIKKQLNIGDDSNYYDKYIEKLFLMSINENYFYKTNKLKDTKELIAFVKMRFWDIDLSSFTEEQIATINFDEIIYLDNLYHKKQKTEKILLKNYNTLLIKCYLVFGFKYSNIILKDIDEVMLILEILFYNKDYIKKIGLNKNSRYNLNNYGMNIYRETSSNFYESFKNIDFFKKVSPTIEKCFIDVINTNKVNCLENIEKIDSILSFEYITIIKNIRITNDKKIEKKAYRLFYNNIKDMLNIDNHNYDKYIKQLFILSIKNNYFYKISKLKNTKEMLAFLKVRNWQFDVNELTDDQIININVKHLFKLNKILDDFYKDLGLTEKRKYNLLLIKCYLIFGFERSKIVLKNINKINELEHLFDSIDIKNVCYDQNGNLILNKKFINMYYDIFKNNDKQSNAYKLFPEIYNNYNKLTKNLHEDSKTLPKIMKLYMAKRLLSTYSPSNYRLIDQIIYIPDNNIVKENLKWYDVMKQRYVSNIPKVAGKLEKYRYEMLDLDDPLILTVGKRTNCCFRLDGVAKTSLKHAMTADNGKVFVVFNGNEVIAQSWVWRDGNIICFDNIESSVADEELSDCYIEAINKIIDVSKNNEVDDEQIKMATIGIHTADLKYTFNNYYPHINSENHLELFSPVKKGVKIYSDAKNKQCVIYKDPDFKIEDNKHINNPIYFDKRPIISRINTKSYEILFDFKLLVDSINYDLNLPLIKPEQLSKYNQAYYSKDWYIIIYDDGSYIANIYSNDPRAYQEYEKLLNVITPEKEVVLVKK